MNLFNIAHFKSGHSMLQIRHAGQYPKTTPRTTIPREPNAVPYVVQS